MRPPLRTRGRLRTHVPSSDPTKKLWMIVALSAALIWVWILRGSVGENTEQLLQRLGIDPALMLPVSVQDRSPEGRLAWIDQQRFLQETRAWQRCAAPGEVGTVAASVRVDEAGRVLAVRRGPQPFFGLEEGQAAQVQAPPAGLRAETEGCVLRSFEGAQLPAPIGAGAQVLFRLHFVPAAVQRGAAEGAP